MRKRISDSHRNSQATSSVYVRNGISMLILGLFLISSVSWNGCSSDDDEQRVFERKAFQEPSGITRTNSSGAIQSEDSDDWRVSPFYSGLVQVEPAFPNPSIATDRVNIHVTVNSIDVIRGLLVGVYDPAYGVRVIWSLYENPLPVGLQVIQVNTMLFGRFNTIESARGLHRVILFDGNENVLSYGDILVE